MPRRAPQSPPSPKPTRATHRAYTADLDESLVEWAESAYPDRPRGPAKQSTLSAYYGPQQESMTGLINRLGRALHHRHAG